MRQAAGKLSPPPVYVQNSRGQDGLAVAPDTERHAREGYRIQKRSGAMQDKKALTLLKKYYLPYFREEKPSAGEL